MDIQSIQAIFWDFDGVIVDSMAVKNNAFLALFEPFGPDIVEKVLDHHLEHGGISRVEKIALYYDRFLNQPLSKEDLDVKCRQFSELVVEKVVQAKPIEGSLAFLEKFHRTIDMYIISGTPQEELMAIVSRRRVEVYFKEILGSPIKKPAHVDSLLAKGGLDPAKCIFIGDAMTDYNTARQTGTRFIGIRGAHPFPDGTVVLPDCSSLEQAIGEL